MPGNERVGQRRIVGTADENDCERLIAEQLPRDRGEGVFGPLFPWDFRCDVQRDDSPRSESVSD